MFVIGGSSGIDRSSTDLRYHHFLDSRIRLRAGRTERHDLNLKIVRFIERSLSLSTSTYSPRRIIKDVVNRDTILLYLAKTQSNAIYGNVRQIFNVYLNRHRLTGNVSSDRQRIGHVQRCTGATKTAERFTHLFSDPFLSKRGLYRSY